MLLLLSGCCGASCRYPDDVADSQQGPRTCGCGQLGPLSNTEEVPLFTSSEYLWVSYHWDGDWKGLGDILMVSTPGIYFFKTSPCTWASEEVILSSWNLHCKHVNFTCRTNAQIKKVHLQFWCSCFLVGWFCLFVLVGACRILAVAHGV